MELTEREIKNMTTEELEEHEAMWRALTEPREKPVKIPTGKRSKSARCIASRRPKRA